MKMLLLFKLKNQKKAQEGKNGIPYCNSGFGNIMGITANDRLKSTQTSV